MILNIDDCRTMSAFEVFTIIQAFSSNCFIPSSSEGDHRAWHDSILPAILSNEHLARIDLSKNQWLPFTLQLVVLGHFDQKLISRVLSPSYLDNYLKGQKLTALNLYKILVLYQTAAMQPNIDLSCVDKKMIYNVCKQYTQDPQLGTCDLQLDLMQHIGKSCVLTNVRTKYMHIIPTLVKFNKKAQRFEEFVINDSHRDQHGFISLESIATNANEVL